jgi:hypothetical protein
LPIFHYFSDVLSYEKVCVEFKDGDFICQYCLTASEACFCIASHAMLCSSCGFFNQFRFLLKYYRFVIDLESYMHMLITTVLIKVCAVDGKLCDKDEIYREVKQFCMEYEKRLTLVYAEVGHYNNKDAALNGMIIAFNLNQISVKGFRHYYDMISKSISGIHIGQPDRKDVHA